MVLALFIGFISNEKGVQKYHYKNQIVEINKKYQCPKHCSVHHHHSVYFDGSGMIIDKNQLGKKVKKKKSRRKK